MANRDTEVNNLIINELTKAEFNSAEKSETELYFVTDEKILASDIEGLEEAFANKQDKLTQGTGINITNNTISNTFTSLDNYTTFSDTALSNNQSFVYKSTDGNYYRGNFQNLLDSIIKPNTIASKIGPITATLVTDGSYGTIKINNGVQDYFMPRVVVARSATGADVSAVSSHNGRLDIPNIFTQLGAAKQTDVNNLATSKLDVFDIDLIEGAEQWL